MSRPSSRLLATAASRIPLPSSSHPQTPLHLLRTATTSTTTTTNIPSRAFSRTRARNNDLLTRLGMGSSQQNQNQQNQQGEQQGQGQGQHRPPGPPRAPRPANPGLGDISRVLTEKAVQRGYGGAGAAGGGADSQFPEQPFAHEILAGSSYSPQYLAEMGMGGDSGSGSGSGGSAVGDLGPLTEPFHFHIYSHKHNTHVTVTKPNRGAILSLSAGNIGFKKSKRGTYDAAYQLTAYVLDKLNQGGWHKIIRRMEVVLRGFGSGREAATKVLLGAEGKMLRHTIVKVSDATKLKFGGTRSKNPRRI